MNTPKTSPLPWRIDDAGPRSGNVVRFEIWSGEDHIGDLEDPALDGCKFNEANAALIVESVNTRPALLSRIEALEGALRRLIPDSEIIHAESGCKSAWCPMRAAINHAREILEAKV